jgi:hypothetical protein
VRTAEELTRGFNHVTPRELFEECDLLLEFWLDRYDLAITPLSNEANAIYKPADKLAGKQSQPRSIVSRSVVSSSQCEYRSN